ncbi:MAG: ABC transporter permease, partial [Oscillospiraceae bacterium]|nr:ABC transporter permease [Oscillospiraceae bacterium]
MEKNKKSFGQVVSNFSMPILLLLLILAFSLLSDRFFTPLNLTNILVQNVHIAICATGVFMIMISGGCDLSIGYQMSVSAVLVAKLLSNGTVGVAPAILLGILICVALGCFNGVMSIALNSQPMIVTLGTMAIFQGISYLISGSKTYHNLPRSFMYLGQGKLFGKIPLNAVIALVVIIIVGVILNRTHVGRKIYAVGDNPEAAKLAGLNVAKIKILVFTCAGILVGISAILLAARSGSADSSTGTGIEFTGIIACVLSGVALKGGEGTLWKAIVAVFVLGVLSNGMQLI